MINVSVIETEVGKKKSNHVLYANEDSNSLVVVFPGGNNSCDRPLLHYLRRMFLDKKYDVLCISYENLIERGAPYDVKVDKLVSRINNAFMKIELDKKYKEKIFISRSFGNVLSGELKKRYSIEVKKNVYISPISQSVEYLSDYPGFIVSSSVDEYLTDDEKSELAKLGNDKVLIFNEANHSLESNNILDTIGFCKEAVAKIDEFVQK